MIEAFGREHGIEVINPTELFKRRAASGANLYLPRDMHFNKEGHRLFAKEIQEYLTLALSV